MENKSAVVLEQWVFLCPVHGEERHVLCFEAFQTKNSSRWRKVKMVVEEIETTLEEREKFQYEMIGRRSTNG